MCCYLATSLLKYAYTCVHNVRYICNVIKYIYICVCVCVAAQELDVIIFYTCIYPLRSKGKDGHSAAAQIVSG